jgi:propanol-preferring alcohol dehydrogenase
MTITARNEDPGQEVQKAIGGAHGALVTAVHPTAFEQAGDMLLAKDTMSRVGAPPGRFALPVFDSVLRRITMRGSIMGTRADLAETLDLAARDKVTSHFAWDAPDNITDVFARMEAGATCGRIVLGLRACGRLPTCAEKRMSGPLRKRAGRLTAHAASPSVRDVQSGSRARCASLLS